MQVQGYVYSSSKVYYDLEYWEKVIDQELHKNVMSTHVHDNLAILLIDLDKNIEADNYSQLHDLIAEKLKNYMSTALERFSDKLKDYKYMSIAEDYWSSRRLTYYILASNDELKEIPFMEGGEFIIKNKKLSSWYDEYWV